MRNNYDYRKVCDDAARETDIVCRQQFIDLMHKGKKIGEAMEATGMSLDAALGTMNRNIVQHSYLNTTST